MNKGDEYEYSGDPVTVWGFVEGSDTDIIVLEGGDYGTLMVVKKDKLIKKEESYYWLQRLKKKEELELITKEAEANLNKVASKIVDRALSDLASRIKFNAMFGKGGNLAWSGMVIDELEKLIKDKPAEKLKEKKGIFD